MSTRRRPTKAADDAATAQELRKAMQEVAELKTNEAIHKAVERIAESFVTANERGLRNELTLERIEKLAIATNGRVTTLEMWRSKTGGVMAAIAAGAAMVGWLFDRGVELLKK